ncbi:MAG: F0F1 ATP synthase subunit alpha [Candidatus Andersenbacteria bacterium]|nr:F0F1 ATP synthase subunit alpha [Candidatus Andersenbacteria bacterium]
MSEASLAGLAAELRAAIAELRTAPELTSVGTVVRVGDGIAWISGLRECGFNEVVEIAGREDDAAVAALAFNLEEDQIGAVLLDDERRVAAGATVRLTGRALTVPVGPQLLGRVVNPLGAPLDDLGEVAAAEQGAIEKIAPGVMARAPVSQPLMTGIKAIDAMIPIGRGQRELLIGDRQTGKTAIALDTIINQHREASGVVCIYVAIGQKMSTVARIVDRLRREGAMEQTIVVATTAADPAALQYLAPYAGAAMGEYFRDRSEDALVVYDDLSKHAWAYRQLSLLLRRPPGREAYPGDVFYLHSRLLERAAKLALEHGGGSLTALPIVETQANDVSGYIPTNIISITDGQIYLESDLFYQGVRPAVNVGLSVSRVGGAAQAAAMKKVAPALRLELAQYRELAAFAQLATDLDVETKQRLERGRRVAEVLKQEQYSLLSLPEQVVILSAVTGGFLDAVAADKVREAEAAILRAARQDIPAVMERLQKTGQLTADDAAAIVKLAQSVVASLADNHG